jgi:hypothetical protein
MLFSDAPIPVSPEWANPNSWSEILRQAGPYFVLVVVFGLPILGSVIFIGYKVAKWLFGPDGWLKIAVESWFGKMTSTMEEMLDRQKQQWGLCQKMETLHCAPGGAANLDAVKEAAHHGAELLREIGLGTAGADKNKIDAHAEAIHGLLRNAPQRVES